MFSVYLKECCKLEFGRFRGCHICLFEHWVTQSFVVNHHALTSNYSHLAIFYEIYAPFLDKSKDIQRWYMVESVFTDLPMISLRTKVAVIPSYLRASAIPSSCSPDLRPYINRSCLFVLKHLGLPALKLFEGLTLAVFFHKCMFVHTMPLLATDCKQKESAGFQSC